MRLWLLALAIVALSAPVLAGPPIQGVYFSNDFPGGSFSPGRFTESWVGLGGHGQVGNTINAQSWNGVILGGEWKLWCPSIAMPPALVSDTRDANGTGEVTWRTTYQGGHFWLSQSGPWGDQDYSGDVDVFIVTATYMYVFGNVLGIRGNVTMTGHFNGYSECLVFSINNTAVFGDTDSGTVPQLYPPFMDPGCNEGTLTRGAWGSITQMALEITGDCQVGAAPSTWGGIKSLYED